jgi:competence protein ComEA
LDALRLTIADWLPMRAGDRLRLMSTSGFGTVLVALLAIAVAIGVVVHDRRQGYSDSYSTSASDDPAPDYSAPAAAASDDGSSIVVDVGGKVRRPGLVTLPVGARVDDAIKAAGGPLHPAELARVDLAARVTDGELLLVGRTAGHSGGTGSSGGLVDLSTASLTKLETLPGVGPVTAGKIVDWRNAHGGFTSVAQLQEVPGIGPTRYAELSPLVAP